MELNSSSREEEEECGGVLTNFVDPMVLIRWRDPVERDFCHPYRTRRVVQQCGQPQLGPVESMYCSNTRAFDLEIEIGWFSLFFFTLLTIVVADFDSFERQDRIGGSIEFFCLRNAADQCRDQSYATDLLTPEGSSDRSCFVDQDEFTVMKFFLRGFPQYCLHI